MVGDVFLALDQQRGVAGVAAKKLCRFSALQPHAKLKLAGIKQVVHQSKLILLEA
jgi:hypothetical protein